jgi:CRISPR-associated endonuclease/helicase Cas3
MVLITKSGRVLTDEDLDRLADEAERGYDLTNWRPRRGRPFLDPAAGQRSPRVSVRVPTALRDRAAARAASEGHSMSEVLRSLLQEYAAGFPGGDGVASAREKS